MFLYLTETFFHKGELRLRDVYHKPLTLLKDSNYDDLIRGLVSPRYITSLYDLRSI